MPTGCLTSHPATQQSWPSAPIRTVSAVDAGAQHRSSYQGSFACFVPRDAAACLASPGKAHAGLLVQPCLLAQPSPILFSNQQGASSHCADRQSWVHLPVHLPATRCPPLPLVGRRQSPATKARQPWAAHAAYLRLSWALLAPGAAQCWLPGLIAWQACGRDVPATWRAPLAPGIPTWHEVRTA